MATSLLKALINIQNYSNNDLSKILVINKQNQPRANVHGDKLDFFIKDSFCNSFTVNNPSTKLNEYHQELSWLGSQNNPPDIIIKNSDAIEVKKVSSLGATSMQLNSSYPKSKIRSDSHFITKECKNCEPNWIEKDIIYAVGHVIVHNLRLLTFVYGDCYAAELKYYQKIRQDIIKGIKKLKLNLSKTKELGRLNNIDPLKSTNLRIRGLWTLKTPRNQFSDHIKFDDKKSLCVFAIMKKEKYLSFDKKERDIVKKKMSVTDIKIKDPNDTTKLIDAKLISFSF